MKQIFTLLIALVAAATASAGSVITAINNGTWANASTRDLNRLSQPGDTIVIPVGFSLAFTGDVNLDGQEMMKQTFQHSAYITLRLGNVNPGVYVELVTDKKIKSKAKRYFSTNL